MIAIAMTVIATADNQPEPATTAHELTDPKRLTAPSINEARRMIAAIVLAAKHVGRQWIHHLEHWSHWRQHHQATARAAHYRRHLAIDTY